MVPPVADHPYKQLTQLFKRRSKPPRGPHAYVMAPKKPKPRICAAAAEREPD
jgi:hypothetical protein